MKKSKLTELKRPGLEAPGAEPLAMEIQVLELDRLTPDPEQPRKTFDQAKLAELAESIRTIGLQQPLRVQLLPATLKIQAPDMFHSDWQAVDAAGAVVFSGAKEEKVRALAGAQAEERYQIIFGERRWRAATLAGLKAVPCIVGAVTDKDKFAIQFVENNARENLSALEEAQAFADQIAKRQLTDAKYNPEALANELGIGRSTVFNRLKLTRLHGPIREALLAGKISTSVAGLVAMIPDPKQQEALLAEITDESNSQFPFSARDVEELVNNDYVKQLDGAPFKSGRDETLEVLIPVETPGATVHEPAPKCRDCPKRSGNMKEQFPELAKRPNVCTDPACYEQKCKAHWLEQAEAEKAKGAKVLTEGEYNKAKSTLIKSSDYSQASGDYYKSWGELLGKKAPAPVLVVTERGLERYFPKDEALLAAKAKGVKFPSDNKETMTPEAKAKARAKEAAAAERQERQEEYVTNQAGALLKGLKKLSDAKAWEVARLLLEGMSGWSHSALEPVLGVVDQKDASLFVLTTLFADEENYPVDGGGDWKKTSVEAWRLAGVDLVAGFEAEESLRTATAALPLKKAEAKQKELLTVKPHKKKGKK